MNEHQQAGIANAVMLIAKATASATTDEEPEFLGDVDEIVNGDSARETLAILAGMAGSLVNSIAVLRMEPVADVLDFVAGCASETVFEEGL